MSNIDNKDLVKKSQAILKDLGVEVKSTQLYEFYSRLMGEKNWNQAKPKNLNFAEKIGIKKELSLEEKMESFKAEALSIKNQLLIPSQKVESFTEIKQTILLLANGINNPNNEKLRPIKFRDKNTEVFFLGQVAAHFLSYLRDSKSQFYNLNSLKVFLNDFPNSVDFFVTLVLEIIIRESMDNKQNKEFIWEFMEQELIFANSKIHRLKPESLALIINKVIPEFSKNFEGWLKTQKLNEDIQELEEAKRLLNKYE